MFIYYTEHIEPVYEQLKDFKSLIPIENLLFKALVLTYQLKIEQISLDTYKKQYKPIIDELHILKLDTVLSNFILMMYHIYFPDEKVINMDVLSKRIIDHHPPLTNVYFMIVMDLYLMILSSNEHIDFKLYETILNKYKEFNKYMHIKNFDCHLNTFQAFLYHLKKDMKKRDDYLYKTVVSAIVIQSKYAYGQFETLIKNVFNMDIQAFLKTQEYRVDALLSIA